MRIKYKVSLRSSAFTKEFCFKENKTVRIGTLQDCHLILPPITINLDRKAGQPVRLSLHLVPKLQ